MSVACVLDIRVLRFVDIQVLMLEISSASLLVSEHLHIS